MGRRERKQDRLKKKLGCSTALPKALAEPQGALKPRRTLEPPEGEARRLGLVPTFLATMPACMGRPEKGHALEDGGREGSLSPRQFTKGAVRHQRS